MDSKGPDAFRTISEVAGDLDLPQHVLRFWETRFSQIKPLKRGGGRRYYRPDDVDLLRGIRHLLYDEGYTIKGVQRILKERGVRFVSDATGEEAGGSNDIGEAAADDDQKINKSQASGSTPGLSHNEVPPSIAPISASPASAPAPLRGPSHHETGAVKERDGHGVAAKDKSSAGVVPPSASPAKRPLSRTVGDGHDEPVPRDIILDDPPARKADGRSLIDKIRGVQEPEQAESTNPAQLSRDDIRRLQSTLFELLECKRILDRSRSG